jgi:hypothetical protein
VHILGIATAAAITLSVTGASYAAFNTGALTQRAETVASAATCRSVDDAIVAYVGAQNAAPRRIADLAPYVRGDISAYRIEQGLAAGPGCPAATARR